MTPPTPYRGRTIAFATMHHKEDLAEAPFRRILGADLHAPNGLDTDQFGTFAGDIPRTLSPRAAARVKAHLGMQIAAMPLGLASEGTFTSRYGPVIENTELLLFLDDTLGIEIVEHSTVASPLPPPHTIDTIDDALHYATLLDFPNQGIVLTARSSVTFTVRKDFDTLDQVSAAARTLLGAPEHVTASADRRAHRSPTRAAHIQILAIRMARRLATLCPNCGTPGYGRIETQTGLPCQDCGTPTEQVAAEIDGCARCDHQTSQPVATRFASPEWCTECNP